MIEREREAVPALSLKGFRFLRFFRFCPSSSDLSSLSIEAIALNAALLLLGLLRYISVA
jgi:hypothetical protein